MEKRSLKDKLNGLIGDSFNPIQKIALENKDHDFNKDISIVYDSMANIIPNKTYFLLSFDYFLKKEDINKDTIYAMNILTDYAKNRLKNINLYGHFMDIMKKEKMIDNPKGGKK